MSDQFRQWLAEELENHNYSHRSFAQAIGKSQTFVSRVLSGERAPGKSFLLRVANELKVDPVTVFTLAGILPPQPPQPPDDDPVITEILESVRKLTPEDRKLALRLIKSITLKSKS